MLEAAMGDTSFDEETGTKRGIAEHVARETLYESLTSAGGAAALGAISGGLSATWRKYVTDPRIRAMHAEHDAAIESLNREVKNECFM
jgi:hypothetical protein